MVTINSISNIKKHFTPSHHKGANNQSINSMSDALAVFLDTLTHANINPVLLYGTCLGLYRDKKVIDYDTDIDVGVFLNDFNALHTLSTQLLSQGFYIKSRNMYCVTYSTTEQNYLIDVWVIVKRKNPFFRLLGYRWLVDHVNFRSDYFSDIQTMTINEKTYLFPNHTETYLAELYGSDWKTPIKNRTAGPRSLLSQWLNAPFVDFKMPAQFSGDNSVGTYKPWVSYILKRFAPNSKLYTLFNHPN